MEISDLSHLAVAGAEIAVTVTPKASRDRIVMRDGRLRVYVTVAPEKGKSNARVRKLLASVLGVPKTRLEVISGLTSRDKVFKLR